MNAPFSTEKNEPSIKTLKISEANPDALKDTNLHGSYYFNNELYLCTEYLEYSSSQYAIVINFFTGQHRSIAIANLPKTIRRPYLFKFVFLQQHEIDGTLLGVAVIYSDSDESEPDDMCYYYSVLLTHTECRVLELIRQFDETGMDYVHRSSQFQLVYKRSRTDFCHFTIYNIYVEYGKPVIKEFLTFDHPDHLRGVSISGNFVVAYPPPLAKERGSLYIRNLMTGESNFLKLPDTIQRNWLLHQLDGHGEKARYVSVMHNYINRENEYRMIVLEMDTNELQIVSNKKIEFYGTICINVEAIDENTLISFNRTYERKPAPRRLYLTQVLTGQIQIHRFSIRKPEKLAILALLASKMSVTSGQIKLPANFQTYWTPELK